MNNEEIVKREPRRKKGIFVVMTVFLVLILIFLSSGITWFLAGSAKKSETTIHIDQIQDMAALATAKAKVTVIKEEVDHKLFGNKLPIEFIPGTKREIFLVIPATVLAGVDLKELKSEDLVVNEEEKTLELTLPKATFLDEPSIHMEDVKPFSNNGFLSGKIEWDEGFDLAAEAQEQIKAEAKEIGILEIAEENAEKFLEGFFSNLGYSVTVSYK